MSRKSPEDDDFLGRWSKRKAEARREPAPEVAPEERAEPEAPPKSDAELLEELGLPDPETLGPGADFSAFMEAAVPDHLRRVALRRLWGSNPVLANLDGMIDYGEDYTDAATVVANLQSAFKAGQGYAEKFAAEEKARAEAEADAAASGEGEERPEASDEPDETIAETAEPASADAAPDRTAEASPEPTDRREDRPAGRDEPPPSPRRRMTFRFDEA